RHAARLVQRRERREPVDGVDQSGCQPNGIGERGCAVHDAMAASRYGAATEFPLDPVPQDADRGSPPLVGKRSFHQKRPVDGAGNEARRRADIERAARGRRRLARRRLDIVDAEFDAGRTGVEGKDRIAHQPPAPAMPPPDQVQSRISGMSSPCSRTYALWATSFASIPSANSLPLSIRPGTRRMAASARWKRSSSFITAMSKGVVVVPSSRKPWTWKLS